MASFVLPVQEKDFPESVIINICGQYPPSLSIYVLPVDSKTGEKFYSTARFPKQQLSHEMIGKTSGMIRMAFICYR